MFDIFTFIFLFSIFMFILFVLFGLLVFPQGLLPLTRLLSTSCSHLDSSAALVTSLQQLDLLRKYPSSDIVVLRSGSCCLRLYHNACWYMRQLTRRIRFVDLLPTRTRALQVNVMKLGIGQSWTWWHCLLENMTRCCEGAQYGCRLPWQRSSKITSPGHPRTHVCTLNSRSDLCRESHAERIG